MNNKLFKHIFALFIAMLPILCNAQNRIIGGYNIDITQRPFQAFVVANNAGVKSIGGGVIINNEWILTAAHVVYGYTVSNIRITVGKTNVASSVLNGGDKSISNVYIHPDYTPGSDASNDIALLKLSSPLTFSNSISPINLSDTWNHRTGTSATVSGWGEIGNGQDDYTHLKAMTNTISSCTNTAITMTRSNSTPSFGDSGGPLTNYSNNNSIQLIGIAAKNSTNSNGTAAIYCNIAPKRSWISSHGAHFYYVSGASTMALNETATFNYSAPGGSIELSSNLQEVSRTSNTITVRAINNGSTYINVLAGNKVMSTASIWIGKPVITGINWDGRLFRVSELKPSGIFWTEWNINGSIYSTYDDFFYPSIIPYGQVTVRVRARNNYGTSDWYEEQMFIENNGGFYSIGFDAASDIITITPEEMYLEFEGPINSGVISYNIVNSLSGRILISGTLPSEGGTIDCHTLDKGSYTVLVDYKGRRVSKKLYIN